MARLITIAGTDRTADIKLEEFSIDQVLTSQEDNCTFTVKSGTKPTAGQEIIVTDGGVKFFAGIIDVVQDDPRAPGITFYKCQARDYTYQLDKKLVVETYANQAADLIVKDILTKYCAGFTSTNVKTGAPTVEEIVFDYKRPSECFKELANYVGWDWYVDYNKDVWFFNPSSLAISAPVIIESSTDVRNLKHDIETVGLRNRVYVRGGTMLSDPWTYSESADGVARAWVLPHKPHDVSLTVGGVAKTVGIENVDDEATKDYLMNYQEKYVRASAQTATPVAGATMAFTYKYDIDVITMMEDIDSQNAIKAVQGGDGVYEHVIVDDSLTTLGAAEAAGDADLREHANPRVKGSFETEIPGWAPGQLVTINLPDRGITGTFLVQKVTITPATHTLWTYRVEYGGRLLGIADWLQALWKAQQKKKLNETALLHKFHYGAETAKVTDEVAGTPRTPPWKVEQGLELTFDPDALTFLETDTLTADFNGTHSGTQATGDAVKLASTVTWTNDISQDLSNNFGYLGYGGATEWKAQRFKATANLGGKTQVRIQLKSDGFLGTSPAIRVHIYSDSSGNVGSSISTTGYATIASGAWPAAGTYVTATINLSSALISGTYYWIVCQPQSGDTSNYAKWAIQTTDVYADGYAAYSNDGGSTWSNQTTYDYAFKVDYPVYTYSTSGTYTHTEQIVSGAGVAGTATIIFNKTTPVNTALTLEVNVYNGSVWSGWVAKNSGDTIISEGTVLTGYKVQWRANLSTTDTSITPELLDVTVKVTPLSQFAAIGSLLAVWQSGSEAWAQPQYRTSTDGITWSAWQGVDPVQRGAIEVPYPGYVRLKANGRVQARNWKKPFVETDIVCGFVMAAS